MPHRLTVLLFSALALTACSTEVKLADDVVSSMRTLWDAGPIEREPLCVEAGPFPFIAGAGRCDRCQELAAAGLLLRGTTYDGRITYELSAEGRPLYRLAPDPEKMEWIRAGYAKNRPGETVPHESTWEQPRICFGRTRFHSIVAALPPMNDGSSYFQSVKVVAVAEDTSGLLFDPRIARLGLELPPRPEPGQPALFPPQIVTYVYDRYSREWGIHDGVRYGAWAFED